MFIRVALEYDIISGYVANVSLMSISTAKEYMHRLKSFRIFTQNRYYLSVDELVEQINEGRIDPYGVLHQYAIHLKKVNNVSNLTLKQRVVTLKNFLEYNDVDISPRKFKFKVKLPRIVKKSKEALTKEDIVDILNSCADIRLKTYVMLLASTGMRAVEALSVRVTDIDLHTLKLSVRGEFTKTKTERTIYLTSELGNQLSAWLSYKYRTRRICHSNNADKTTTEYRTPKKNGTDLIFAVHQLNPDPNYLYKNLRILFAKTLDRTGRGTREDGNERRREITLHSFRRFVKTTISDLGYQDFSEYFIGHSGSTYWTKKESEKAEIFRKIEPYLTFLNVHELERQGADIESKIGELEDLNQSFRERDKMKDDAIAHLSDQLLALTARMQDLERRQQ